MWLMFAIGSAFFAGITAVLAKIGIENVNSTLATALRTIVVLVFSWAMVLVVGSLDQLGSISAYTLAFLVLSGLATGASWLCYFRALQLGDVNKVAPIDKSSTVLTVLLAFILLGEPVGIFQAIGVVCIGAGSLLMVAKSISKPTNPKNDSEIHRNNASSIDPHGNESSVQNHGNTASQTINSTTAQINESAASQINDSAAAQQGETQPRLNWLLFAVLSAVFASLTAILGKVGISGVESNLGTAIRTTVVLAMAWAMVFVTKTQGGMRGIKPKSWLFLALSGLATGASWLCYYRALQDGPASIVAPIDKLSILVTIAFSYLALHEKESKRQLIGLAVLTAGTLLMLVQ